MNLLKLRAFFGLVILLLLVFNGAWTTNDFAYKPSLGARGEQEKATFDSGLDRVDARLGKEIWVGDPKYGSTLQAALAALVATPRPVTLHVPAGTYTLSSSLTVPSNTHLLFHPGATVVSDRTPANQPSQYFLVNGNNVTIDGLQFSLGDETKVANDINHGVGIALSSGISNFTLKNSDLRYFIMCVKALGTLDNVTIKDNKFVGVYIDLWLAGFQVSGSHVRILNNQFPVQRIWTSPIGNIGAICVWGGSSPGDSNHKPTDTMYETQFIGDVEIRGNDIRECGSLAWPINLFNLDGVRVVGNNLVQGVGLSSTPGVADDLIVLNLCRNFTVADNTTYGGGQNGIDIMACVNGTVTGNTMKKLNTSGISITGELWYRVDPSITLSKKYLKNAHFTVIGNNIEAFNPILFEFGQHIIINANTFKINTANSYSSTYLSPYVVFNLVSPYDALVAAHPELAPGNIKIGNDNRIDVGPKYLVTANAGTDKFTTSVAHDFVTGEPVELLVGGDVTTVDLPTGWGGSGTHNGPGNSATLKDTTKNFVTTGVTKGMWVVNVTDGSQGRITNITTTTNPNDTITATLSGGSENDWDAGDAYQFRLPYYEHYWIIKVDATNVKLATSFANAQAGTAIDILNAGGGTGQEIYLRRWPYRVVAVDTNFLTYCDPRTIELAPNLAHELVRLFDGYAGEALPEIFLPQRRLECEYILDPGIAYGSGGAYSYKSWLPKYIKMPPYFYHPGDATDYGVGILEYNKYVLFTYMGAHIMKYNGIPSDKCGYFRMVLY